MVEQGQERVVRVGGKADHRVLDTARYDDVLLFPLVPRTRQGEPGR